MNFQSPKNPKKEVVVPERAQVVWGGAGRGVLPPLCSPWAGQLARSWEHLLRASAPAPGGSGVGGAAARQPMAARRLGRRAARAGLAGQEARKPLT